MSKYINADEFIATIRKSTSPSGAEWIVAKVNEMPSADVRENIHGEWIENDNGTYSCSLCQSWIPKEQYYYARYCLHCGADMRERKESE